MRKAYKNVVALAVSVFLMFSLTACGSQTTSTSSNNSGSSSGAKKPEFSLRFGEDQAPDHAYTLAAQWFAQKVEERTNGRVHIDVFPNAQLGEEATMLDSIRMGTLDFSISSTSNASSHVPEMGLLSMAYLFNGPDHIYKAATDKLIVDKYTKLVANRNLGIKLVTFLPNGLRSMYSNKEIHSIDDVQGVKMRTMASPVEIKVWTAIGTKATTVPFNEVYTALQTKMVTAAENTPSSYFTAKHYESAPYFIETGHEWLMSEVWISDKTWAKLPDDIRKVIMDTGAEMAKYGLDKQQETDKKTLDEMVSKYGVKDIKIDVAPFKAKVLPLQDDVAKELKSEDILARIRELAK